jgi:hypothetical protein
MTAHPSPVEFETCPDWVPGMDIARPVASMMMKTKSVHGFDHTANWMAEVRNASNVGSQSSIPEVHIRRHFAHCLVALRSVLLQSRFHYHPQRWGECPRLAAPADCGQRPPLSSGWFSREKGRRPASALYSTTPNEKISLRASVFCPEAYQTQLLDYGASGSFRTVNPQKNQLPGSRPFGRNPIWRFPEPRIWPIARPSGRRDRICTSRQN